MKKTVAAVSAGLLLVAAQAATAQSSAAPRVNDRLGGASGEFSEFGGFPLIGIIAAAGVVAAGVAIATNDDSESD